MTNAIHQELVLDTTPERLFEIWMDSKLHGEFTGSAAKIGPKAGDAFECGPVSRVDRVERRLHLGPPEQERIATGPLAKPLGVLAHRRFAPLPDRLDDLAGGAKRRGGHRGPREAGDRIR